MSDSRNSTGETSVVLVNMPVSGIERPSIALGLIKTILTDAGIGSSVSYANLWFVEHFGLSVAQTLITCRPEDAVVDWLFGAAAFPDFAPDHARFLAEVRPQAPQLLEAGLTDDKLLSLRRAMPAFVDEVARKIAAGKPRIVGCTSMFQQHVATLALLRRLKEIAPDIVTIVGGANCESVMGRTTHAQFPWVDYVVSGEADQFAAELFGRILADGRDMPAEAVPFGVFAPVHRAVGYPATATGDGAPRAVTEDVRDLPLPDYGDYFAELDNSLYKHLITPGIPMEFSRGCWWGAKSHCTFCGLNGGNMAYRSKRPERVVDEMETLAERYGTRRIEAVDNIMDMAYFREVLPRLAAREEPLVLFFETKANLRKVQVEALAAAGVQWIQPGIESLDSRVLKLMGKGCTAAQNVLLLKWCRQYGVRASWSVISEFPGEEDPWYAEMAALMPALHHLQAGVTIPLRYDRYSPYHMRPERYGLKLRPAGRYRDAYPIAEADLCDQVYFFEDEKPRPTGAERPGLRAMRIAMVEWRRIWRAAPPIVVMQDTADGLAIEDTRPGRSDAVLRGVDRALVLAADDGPPETALRRSLAEEGHDEAAVTEAAERLIAARLLVRLDGRLIAMPLARRPADLPRPSAFPGGHVARGAGLAEQLLALV